MDTIIEKLKFIKQKIELLENASNDLYILQEYFEDYQKVFINGQKEYPSIFRYETESEMSNIESSIKESKRCKRKSEKEHFFYLAKNGMLSDINSIIDELSDM